MFSMEKKARPLITNLFPLETTTCFLVKDTFLFNVFRNNHLGKFIQKVIKFTVSSFPQNPRTRDPRGVSGSKLAHELVCVVALLEGLLKRIPTASTVPRLFLTSYCFEGKKTFQNMFPMQNSFAVLQNTTRYLKWYEKKKCFKRFYDKYWYPFIAMTHF